MLLTMIATITFTSCEKELGSTKPTHSINDISNARSSSPFDEYVGDEITFTEFDTLTANFQADHPNWPASFQVSDAILDTLFSPEECTGMAIYYAIDSENNGYHVLCPIVDTTISNLVVYKSTSSGAVATTETAVNPDIVRFMDNFPDWANGHATGYVIVDELRDQSGALGVKFYNAMPDEYSSTICMVGYDVHDNDISGKYADKLRGFHKRKKQRPLGGGGINTGGTAAGGAGGIGSILTGPIPQ